MSGERGRKSAEGSIGLSRRVHDQDKQIKELKKRVNILENKPSDEDFPLGATIRLYATGPEHEYEGVVVGVTRYRVIIKFTKSALKGTDRSFNKGQIAWHEVVSS